MRENINDLLEPNDKIWLVYYLDHALAREKIDIVKSKPFILWTIGKILNEKDNDKFYFLVNSGRLYRIQPPQEYQVIVKSCIVKKKLIYTIPEENN